MDPLTDAITALSTGRPHTSLPVHRAPWGQWFDPIAGLGFHVVLQGACWLVPSDGEARALSAGDVVLLNSGRGHGLADSPTTPLDDTAVPEASGTTTGLLCGAYLLDRSRSHPLLDELPDVVHIPAHVGRHQSLRAAVGLLGAEIARPRPGSDGIVTAMIDALLLYVLRAWLDEQAETDPLTGWAAALADPAVGTALRAIHQDPSAPWTVEGLATAPGLSRTAFAQRFTTHTGRTPLAYLTWWRMTVAANRLTSTDEPLATIARHVGYTSEFAFAKAFKRDYGTAPGTYRRTAGQTPSQRPSPTPTGRTSAVSSAPSPD